MVGIAGGPGAHRALLDLHGCDLAGPHAEEREPRRIGDDRLDLDLPAVPARPRQRHERGVGEALPCRDADPVVERARARRRLGAVASGRRLDRHAVGQLSGAFELVVHDRSVDERRTDDPSVIVGQRLEKAEELCAGQEPSCRGHQGSVPAR